jgi:hypothetical protein
MLLANIPTLVAVPFASGAGSSYINPIPVASQIGVGDGSAASMTTGFPPKTFLPEDAGGIPPHGGDFNGVLNLGSAIDQWSQAGGGYPYNATFSGTVGGYPKGAIIQRSDATGDWISTVDGNTTNPDTGGAGWLPYGGSTQIYVQALTNLSVTAPILSAACPIIVLTGALTANVNLVLPAWVSNEWLISNQCTGAFTVTAKTASGSGVAVAVGSTTVYCSSAGIQSGSASSGTVVSVAVTPANGVSAANVGTATAPVFAFTLGSITPALVSAGGAVTGGATQAISVMETATGGLGGLGVNTSSSNAFNSAFMYFNNTGKFAGYFGIGNDNNWRVGGWSMGAVSYRVVHEGLSAVNFAGSISYTTSDATLCDRRYKENIHRVDPRPLHRRLPFYEYTRKDIAPGQPGHRARSGMAQDARKIDPDLVQPCPAPAGSPLKHKDFLGMHKTDIAYEEAMYAGLATDRHERLIAKQARLIERLTKQVAKLSARA